VFNADGSLRFTLEPFPRRFRGGVRVAVGDVNGDGVADVVTGIGPGGGSLVRVWDGRTGQPLAGPLGEFRAFARRSPGGVYVAAADTNGDGFAEVVVGSGAGRPRVRVFDGRTGALLRELRPYSAKSSGVQVAVGDVNGDGLAEVITGPGPFAPPRIRVFDARSGARLGSFLAYRADKFCTGVFVSAGDVDADGRAEVITSPGFSGPPEVRVFDGLGGRLLRSLRPFPDSFLGGVRVGSVDVDGDGRDDLLVSPGVNSSPRVRAYSGADLRVLLSIDGLPSGFRNGAFVAGR
jgi:hypothetical protein